MDNYVLLILKMQQIRPKNKVLHGSASNYKLSDLHKWIEAANQHIITNRRLRLPITKQTINKYCYSSWVGDTSQLSIRFPWQFARTQSYFWLQVQLIAQKHEKIIRRDLGSTFCDPIADLSSIKSKFCLSNVETKKAMEILEKNIEFCSFWAARPAPLYRKLRSKIIAVYL